MLVCTVRRVARYSQMRLEYNVRLPSHAVKRKLRDSRGLRSHLRSWKAQPEPLAPEAAPKSSKRRWELPEENLSIRPQMTLK